jgi:hypothetical protein
VVGEALTSLLAIVFLGLLSGQFEIAIALRMSCKGVEYWDGIRGNIPQQLDSD